VPLRLRRHAWRQRFGSNTCMRFAQVCRRGFTLHPGFSTHRFLRPLYRALYNSKSAAAKQLVGVGGRLARCAVISCVSNIHVHPCQLQ